MDFLEKNWEVISANIWIFASFGLSCIGGTWLSARFFFNARLEFWKEKVEDAEKRVEIWKDKFTELEKSALTVAKDLIDVEKVYPPSGTYGRNLLSAGTLEAKVGEKLSFRAVVPNGVQSHVRIVGSAPNRLDDSASGWQMLTDSRRNWIWTDYDETAEGCEQHFDAEAGVADMHFEFIRVGRMQLHITTTPGGETLEKTISVRKG